MSPLGSGDAVYLDHQASTPVDPRVLEAMLPLLTDAYGNASSAQHERGRQVAEAVERARVRVSTLLGASPQEIVFTSGATEANNLTILGSAARHSEPAHIISCTTEHPAVLEPLRALERRGWAITYLPVDERGELDLEHLERHIRSDTALISLMTANNEIGTLHPLEAVSAIARDHGIPVHTDAAQAVAKIRVDVGELGVDFLSLSAHKIYGPQGIGALFIRRGATNPHPLLHGGGQEAGVRSGTLNAPGIVGLGMACEVAAGELACEPERLGRQRTLLMRRLLEGCSEMRVNGAPAPRRLPGSLHVSVPGVDADAVMANCPGVAMASGSACSSATPGPSHVLRAIGMPDDLADGSLRLSVGRFTTDEEVETAAQQILAAIRRVRALTDRPSDAGVVAA